MLGISFHSVSSAALCLTHTDLTRDHGSLSEWHLPVCHGLLTQAWQIVFLSEQDPAFRRFCLSHCLSHHHKLLQCSETYTIFKGIVYKTSPLWLKTTLHRKNIQKQHFLHAMCSRLTADSCSCPSPRQISFRSLSTGAAALGSGYTSGNSSKVALSCVCIMGGEGSPCILLSHTQFTQMESQLHFNCCTVYCKRRDGLVVTAVAWVLGNLETVPSSATNFQVWPRANHLISLYLCSPSLKERK